MKKNVFRRGMAFALSTAVAVSIVPPLGTGSTARAASDASPVKNEVNLGMSSLYTDSTSWSKSTGQRYIMEILLMRPVKVLLHIVCLEKVLRHRV
ncbi:hypothetical protein [Clostridium sp. L2-50]|uniref:hypothetical protein n=1 Tax=Clostridium sp. L2-50 TaxID=411489 RepID=UPI002381728C|nr:hypothetical protein [Clostridium sp. L2-50]